MCSCVCCSVCVFVCHTATDFSTPTDSGSPGGSCAGGAGGGRRWPGRGGQAGRSTPSAQAPRDGGSGTGPPEDHLARPKRRRHGDRGGTPGRRLAVAGGRCSGVTWWRGVLAALTTLPAAGGWRRAGRMARCPHGTVYTDGAALAWLLEFFCATLRRARDSRRRDADHHVAATLAAVSGASGGDGRPAWRSAAHWGAAIFNDGDAPGTRGRHAARRHPFGYGTRVTTVAAVSVVATGDQHGGAPHAAVPRFLMTVTRLGLGADTRHDGTRSVTGLCAAVAPRRF